MIEQSQIKEIKEAVEEFFEKMTILISNVEVNVSSSVEGDIQDNQDLTEKTKDVVGVEVSLAEPQILIGQGGQTLFEIQRLLRMVLNKKLQKIFYFNLDINGYKKKKIEYLKDFSKGLADQVSLTKEEKALLPMPAYERRVVHAELSKRADVVTESRGEGLDRHIVIKPR